MQLAGPPLAAPPSLRARALAGSLLAHALLALLLARARGPARGARPLELRLDAALAGSLELLVLGGAGPSRAGASSAAMQGGLERPSSVLVREPVAQAAPPAEHASAPPVRGARTLAPSSPVPSILVDPAPAEPGPSAASDRASPFLLGRPGANARAPGAGPAAPSSRDPLLQGGAAQLGAVRALARAAGVGEVDALASAGASAGEGPDGGGGAGVAAYARERLRAEAPRHVPGAVAYFQRALAALRGTWRPRVRREPSLVDAVAGTFFTSPERYAEIQRRALGAMNPDAPHGGHAAAAELDQAHANSPAPPPLLSMSARSHATERETTVELDVEQDPQGRVRVVRVVRRSGVSGFDRVAEDAVRDAIAQTPPPPQGMGRGWRSRWVCQVIAARSPLLTGVPGVGGSAPNIIPTVEAELDPNPGDPPAFRYPGSLHVRSRARVVRSELLP